MNILCIILGHKWLWYEPLYLGDKDGKFCERCGIDKIG